MQALCFETFGGPEVLSLRSLPDPVAGPGEVLVRTEAIGLNFADLYRRKGTYHLEGKPPFILGYEGAGQVVALGAGVQGLRVGARAGFADVPHANAELVRVPFDKLIPLPEDIASETAAAVLLQGLTAQYLLRDSHRVQAGETVLVHAAAGGVGSLLVQLAVSLGAKVMGLSSSPEKCARVRELGAHFVALYSEDWVAKAHVLSRGGVDVVYDAVGSTLPLSFEATRKGGHVVFYGMAGGNPPLVDPRMLMDTSKTLTGGDLWNVLTSREVRLNRAEQLFAWVRSGALKVDVSRTFALSEGAEAHRFLESRTSTGKVLLRP